MFGVNDVTTLKSADTSLTKNNDETSLQEHDRNSFNEDDVTIIDVDDFVEVSSETKKLEESIENVECVLTESTFLDEAQSESSVAHKRQNLQSQGNENDTQSRPTEGPSMCANPFARQQQIEQNVTNIESEKICKPAKKRRRLYRSVDVPEVEEKDEECTDKTVLDVDNKATQIVGASPKQILKDKITEHANDGSICVVCGVTFANKRELIGHQKTLHSNCFQE